MVSLVENVKELIKVVKEDNPSSDDTALETKEDIMEAMKTLLQELEISPELQNQMHKFSSDTAKTAANFSKIELDINSC